MSVVNDSTRDAQKIRLELIRYIAFYRNSAACSAFQTVDQRIPERVVSKTISISSLSGKSNSGDDIDWTGIKAGCRSFNVCQISVPCDELSVSAGRYFDTRYVIKIFVHTKGGEVELELPITVVHVWKLLPDLVGLLISRRSIPWM